MIGIMDRRPLGNTSLQVSPIGFGAAPLGNVFGAMDNAEVEATVALAIERGINFFDVSPYYGITVAETRLGQALRRRRENIILATKCGRYGLDDFDFSAATITRRFEDSLTRLQTDSVDLLQAHDVEFGTVAQIVHETIPAMRRLQQQGKARFIGITGYSLTTLMSIAAQAPVDTILTYCRYNLLIDSIDHDLIPFAETRGIAVINASPLHMGILTPQGPPPWHPAPPVVKQMGQKMEALCRGRGRDLPEVGLNFCFQHPKIATTLVGMIDRHQVEAAIRALTTPLDPQLLADLRSLAEPVYGLTWPSGLPENQG